MEKGFSSIVFYKISMRNLVESRFPYQMTLSLNFHPHFQTLLASVRSQSESGLVP